MSAVSSGTLGERLALFAASLVYAGVILYCMSAYASIEWARYGHSYGNITALEALLILAALGTWAAVMPVRLDGPADVILFVVYLGVSVPGVLVPLGLERPASETYHPLVISITLGYAACCLLVRRYGRSGRVAAVRRCSPAFVYALAAAWAVCIVILYLTYGSVMTLVSLDAIYDQREAGAATNRFMGYVQTYFGYVFSPALMAFGLARRNLVLVLAGIAGGIVLYSVTAEKNAFAFPFVLLAFHFALTRRNAVFQSSAFILLFLATLLGICVYYYDSSLVASFLAWYIGVRSLLTPGLFVAQYYDFFSEWGFTHLSQVTGFGILVPAPPAPFANERWPSLGHIVGEQYVGIPGLNANASFLTTDGVAAFGALGAIVAMLLLAAFLVALERAAAGVPRRFMMVIAMPIGLTLTNVSLFTVFLSFGGLFWLVALQAFRARGGRLPVGGPTTQAAYGTH